MTVTDTDGYLERIGVAADAVTHADRTTLARLQSAHARSVPFETLSITGDPYGPYTGEPITLTEAALYEKVVERRRGGFCYELNGAFASLLDALGYDVRRCAARVAAADGGYGPPADHLTLLVSLDRQFLVDVGVGAPVIRRPVPVDGSVVENAVGVEWRLVDPERPDADYRLEYRGPGDDAWQPRFILSAAPRELSYFAATCEHHSTSPESPFTGDPIAMRPTADGRVSLSPGSLTRTVVGGESRKREIDASAYRDLLAEEITVRLPDD